MPDNKPRLLTLAAVAALIVAFLALNYQAFDSYFQDDEFDNMAWTPFNDASQYAIALVNPQFDQHNFRPTGAAYFRWMTRAAGSEFPSWVPSLFLIHLCNGALLFLLLRRLHLNRQGAWLGTAFFVLSGAAMDAFWKPMYVFDLLCTAFSLASLLFYARRQWVLSFVAFWLAYKSKELAVMLPLCLLFYEHWLGDRRYLRLIPFLAVSLSFGIQGIVFNPNKDNDYTFRFSWSAVRATLPFYLHRFAGFRGSGLLLAALLLVRDRRVWFGLATAAVLLSILLFLPGRRFEAYAYLPLACVAIALAAAASRQSPRLAWGLFAIWLPWNVWVMRQEQQEVLTAGDNIASFAAPIERFARRHPEIRTLVYDSLPPTFHHWGATGAWNYGHRTLGLLALPMTTPQAIEALNKETVAVGRWNAQSRRMRIVLHAPLQPGDSGPR